MHAEVVVLDGQVEIARPVDRVGLVAEQPLVPPAEQTASLGCVAVQVGSACSSAAIGAQIVAGL